MDWSAASKRFPTNGNSAASGESIATVNADAWVVYQPLIVGLGAVVIATIGNSFVEWFRAHISHKRSKTVLRRALLEELRIIRDSLNHSISACRDCPQGQNLIIPIQEQFPVYNVSIGQIGFLDAEEAGPVVKAYTYLAARIETYSVIGRIERTQSVVLHAIVGNEYALMLADSSRKLHDIVNDAVQLLERN